jgi:hypothetical protein
VICFEVDRNPHLREKGQVALLHITHYKIVINNNKFLAFLLTRKTWTWYSLFRRGITCSSSVFIVSPSERLTQFAEAVLGSGDTGFGPIIGVKKTSSYNSVLELYMLKAGRSRVRIPMKSLDFSIDLISHPQYGPVIESASNRNEYQESSWR